MDVTVAEMEKNLSELLERVASGETIVVTREGKPFVTMRPPEEAATETALEAAIGTIDPYPAAPDLTDAELIARRRSLRGIWKGQVWIADDFDELGPEWDEYVKS